MSESLEEAARAVRDGNGGESADADATLRRVLQRSRRLGRRRRGFHLVVAPLLAALVASVAWGASTGRLSSFVSALTNKLEQNRPREGGSGTRSPAPRPPAAPVSPAGPDETPPVRRESSLASESAASTGVDETPAPASMGSAERHGARRQPAPPRAEIAPAASGTPMDADSLYRIAHRAQFESRDYAAAAAAADRYLEAAPNGTFAPEARWSRAIALVRLGRKAEAVIALGPFARGDYGPYRRDEARALLDASKK